MTGLDLLIIGAVILLAWFVYWLIEDGRRRFDRIQTLLELEQAYRRDERRWAAEVEGVPEEWVEQLDELKRLPSSERVA